ncbi:hypothetical protein EC988_006998, partial [Linderina pennispora]
MNTGALLLLIFFSLVVTCAVSLIALGRFARLYAVTRARSNIELPVRQTTTQLRPSEQPVKPYNVFSENELSLLETVTLTQADIDAIATNSSAHQDNILDRPRYLSAECTICLLPFQTSDVVRALMCGHMFHVHCIDVWLVQRSARCPLCKLDTRRSVGLDFEPQNSSENHVALSIDPSLGPSVPAQDLDTHHMSRPPAVAFR